VDVSFPNLKPKLPKNAAANRKSLKKMARKRSPERHNLSTQTREHREYRERYAADVGRAGQMDMGTDYFENDPAMQTENVHGDLMSSWKTNKLEIPKQTVF